jgi:hypothetical protein
MFAFAVIAVKLFVIIIIVAVAFMAFGGVICLLGSGLGRFLGATPHGAPRRR